MESNRIASKGAPYLLFDFGGVLTDLNATNVLASFDALGIDIRPYLGGYKQSGAFSLLERGLVSVPEFCERMRNELGKPNVTDEDFVRAWKSYLDGVPEERLKMLLKIRRHYSVSLLSNINSIHWSLAEDVFFRYNGLGVNDFFDKIFLSFRLGYEKPDPEIYRLVIEGIGVNPADILFFDDSEDNCEAARRMGMQSLLAEPGSGWFKYFDEDGKLHLS